MNKELQANECWLSPSSRTQDALLQLANLPTRLLMEYGVEVGIGAGKKGILIFNAPFLNTCDFVSTRAGWRANMSLLAAVDLLLRARPRSEAELLAALVQAGVQIRDNWL